MARVILILFVVVAVVVGTARFFYAMHPKAQAAQAAQSPGSNRVWAQNRIEYIAWDGERWTAWVKNGQFVLVPENTEDWSRRSGPAMAFLDWEGQPWQAKIEGEEFLLAHRGDWNGPIERGPTLRYRDWAGSPELRSIEQLRR